jgi:hypothetical protein
MTLTSRANHLRCCVVVDELVSGAVDGGTHVKIPAAAALPRISVIGRVASNATRAYSCVRAIGCILRPTQWLVEIQRMARME